MWLITNILSYVGEYRKSGNEYNFRCPICGDSHKDKRKKRGYLGLKNGKLMYYCQNCNNSVSAFHLLKILSGTDFDDLKVEYFHYRYGKNATPTLSASFDQYVKKETSNVLFNQENIIDREWKQPLSDKAKEYLANRKVTEAPFLREDLYSCYTKNGSEFILIPWLINGVASYYQLNDFQKIDPLKRKYIFPKNKEKMIYGLDNIDLSWPYIIVEEGVYDSLFIPNGIAVGGKNLTEKQYEIITKRYPKHQIVIGFDNDEAGLSTVQKMIEKDNRGFKYFKWFNENTKQKDINDYVLAKNDVNIFTNKSMVERLIVDSLRMKMYMLKNNQWKSEVKRSFKSYKKTPLH